MSERRHGVVVIASGAAERAVPVTLTYDPRDDGYGWEMRLDESVELEAGDTFTVHVDLTPSGLVATTPA